MPSRVRCEGALPASRSSCSFCNASPRAQARGPAQLFRFGKSVSLGSDRYGHFRGMGCLRGTPAPPQVPKAACLVIYLSSFLPTPTEHTALNVETTGN